MPGRYITTVPTLARFYDIVIMTPDATSVRIPRPYLLDLSFADGLRGCVDPAYFAQARVDAEVGTVVWPNGADPSPEFLYQAAAAVTSPPSRADPGRAPRI